MLSMSTLPRPSCQTIVRAGDEPEAGVLGMLGGTFAAAFATKLPDLIVVLSPLIARKRDRRWRPKLGRASGKSPTIRFLSPRVKSRG